MASEQSPEPHHREDAEAPGTPIRVFVYGTLKRGDSRHHWLDGQRFLGLATTLPRYRMYNVGTYPGLIESPNDGLAIRGEVWEVTPECLTTLDDVEGIDEGLYRRDVIQLEAGSFGTVQAYFYLQSVTGCPDCGEEWPVKPAES